jgi:hypothetical protein
LQILANKVLALADDSGTPNRIGGRTPPSKVLETVLALDVWEGGWMSSAASKSRSKAKKARLRRAVLQRRLQQLEVGLAFSSSATASPSIRQPAGSCAAALTSA